MLRFSLFGFPITVHWMFWVVIAFLGGIEDANTPAGLQRVLVWVAAAFVSIIWHELGHAFAMRKFGDRNPHILLYGFGGMAVGRGWRTRNEQIIISLAGPAAGLLLALGTYLVAHWLVFPRIYVPQMEEDGIVFLKPTHGENLILAAVGSMFVINFWWSILNLLPIIPLDGGRVSEAVLASRRSLALRISFVCAAAIAVWFLSRAQIFNALLFAMLAIDNWRALRGQPPMSGIGQ